MKLSTAINKAPKVFAYVQMGDGHYQLQVSKKNAKAIARTWLDDENQSLLGVGFGEDWLDDESGRIIATMSENTGNVYLG